MDRNRRANERSADSGGDSIPALLARRRLGEYIEGALFCEHAKTKHGRLPMRLSQKYILAWDEAGQEERDRCLEIFNELEQAILYFALRVKNAEARRG